MNTVDKTIFRPHSNQGYYVKPYAVHGPTLISLIRREMTRDAIRDPPVACAFVPRRPSVGWRFCHVSKVNRSTLSSPCQCSRLTDIPPTFAVLLFKEPNETVTTRTDPQRFQRMQGIQTLPLETFGDRSRCLCLKLDLPCVPCRSVDAGSGL